MRRPPPAILGALLPVIAYFSATRLAGLSQLTGVVLGIVTGLVIVAWRMLATRQVGQLELFTTAILAVALIPSLVTGEPRIALAAQSIDGFFAAAYFLVSAFTRRPLVASILEPMYVKALKVEPTAWDRCLDESPRFRLRIRWMSVVCAITAVTGSSAGLYLALHYPIDTVVLVGPVIGFVLVPLALLVIKLADQPLRMELRRRASPRPA
ncbi:VC0807 family protein [Tsukamurella sputi]|uniref:VC0807 family protein n=1 Tax=Tsukamurella sputi TaxID=2591848 RepID=UPI0027BA9771|nr:VC0807 family protein [Tsukamurella sputi]